MAKSPEEMVKSMLDNLEKTTGKSLPEWEKIVRASKKAKHGEIVKYLKEEYGIGHGYANMITLQALRPVGAPERGSDELVDTQYAGPKAALRPIYDALIALVRKFGDDVEIAPKKAYVSLRRAKQFALIQPTTATRIDVGINLKGDAPTARLENSGSFNAMVSHRVRIANLKEIDKELEAWLKTAYEQA